MIAGEAEPAAPSSMRTPLSGIRPRPQPLLASDALREDVAPLEPACMTSRLLCGGGATVLGSVALLLVMALRQPALSLGPIQAAVASAVLAGLALAPVSYRGRAAAMAITGGVLLLEGALGLGPAGGLRTSNGSPAWELARVLAASLLPAALLFRAHYRAYPRARLLLGWGLALALPFVVRCGYIVIFAQDVASRIVAGATIASVLLSLVGFMGAGTTAMGSAWAVSVLAFLSVDVAARVFLPGASPAVHLVASAAFLAAESLAAFGIFQLFAGQFACDARKIDVLRSLAESSD